MNAPQIIMIVLAVISLMCSIWLDGERKSGRHDFKADLLGIVILQALLIWGGFYG